MATVRHSELLGRPLRMDIDIRELGENTLDKLKAAIEKGDKGLALELAEYLLLEGKGQHDSYADWLWVEADYVARTFGEEELPKMLRHVKSVLDRSAYHAAKKHATPLERLVMYTEGMRAHRSGPRERGDFVVKEEADRYVMEMDPCGGGGRMARGPIGGTGSRLKAPFNLGVTSKPYPWSWGKAGVPYYCLHCCVWNEVMAIESVGYPWKITEYPAGDHGKPCRWLFYKDPNLIPDEYFERVGFKKDPQKFKR